MKNSKIILYILAICVVAVVAFFAIKNNQPVNPDANNGQASILGCYVSHIQKDVYTLTIQSIDNKIVTGKVAYNNFEKDSSSGTFTGTFEDGILLGDYSFDSEGMHSYRQLIFKQVDGNFVEGFGDVKTVGDKEMFTDITKVSYDSNLIFIRSENCTDQNTIKSEALSIKDATYSIDGQSVTLVNGVSSVPAAPGSASMVTTRYFGNEVKHDFDMDGRLDTAFILTQNTGGSGTFYYVVVALNMARGYVGSEGILLGDRITPQSIQMSANPSTPDVIVVNYLDRKTNEPFTVQPSVAKSIWLKLDLKTMQFGEVTKNFEGEADPSKMTLGMKTWNWVNTIYSDGKVVTPKTNKFVLMIKDNKTFSAGTDCNGVGGEYLVSGKNITFTKMMLTMMYCDGSQEQDYSKMLSQVQSYMFTSKGELVLMLKYDSGSMIFR